MGTAIKVYGSYDEVIADSEIDAVYVPLPTGLRKSWVIRAADAGKHVLCEKPCAVALTDLKEMFAACQRNGVQFIDGVMFQHNPRQRLIEDVLKDSETFGEIRRIDACFSLMGGPDFFEKDIRANTRLEPHGALRDLGWYPIRFAVWAMGDRKPVEARGRFLQRRKGNGNEEGCIADFSGELAFEGGATAGFFCSFVSAAVQCARIVGTKSYIDLGDMVHGVPNEEGEYVFSVRRELFKVPDVVSCPVGGDGSILTPARNLFDNYARQIATGELNADWPMLSLVTQAAMDACYQSALKDGRSAPVEL